MDYEGKALSIGASDPNDNSGVDTDLKTFCSFNILGFSVSTSIVLSDSLGSKDLYDIPSEVVGSQIDSIMENNDINTVKVGMITVKETLEVILDKIKEFDIDKVISDPSLIDQKGDRILDKEAEDYFKEEFLPNSFLVILNYDEAELICGIEINNQNGAEKAAEKIYKMGPEFVILIGNSKYEEKKGILFDGEKFDHFELYETSSENKLESDSTFSAAITSCVSKGMDIDRTIVIAEDYVKRAILNYPVSKGKMHLYHNIEPLEVTAFEEEAADFDSWFENNKAVFESEFKAEERLMVNPGNAVSIGVGSGLFASRLGIRYGVEPARSMAENSKDRGIEVIRGYAEDVPLPDEQFDAVLMSTVLSYVDDPQRAVNEAYRILKNGGKLVVSFLPKEGSYTMMYDLAMMRGKHDMDISPEHPYPVKFIKGSNWLTTDQVTSLMKEAGFTNFEYVQTLTKHPKYTNEEVEEPVEGYKKGDYVVIRGEKT